MKVINLNDGDTAIIKKTLETICRVSSGDNDKHIYLGVDVRNSLAAPIGDCVLIIECHQVIFQHIL